MNARRLVVVLLVLELGGQAGAEPRLTLQEQPEERPGANMHFAQSAAALAEQAGHWRRTGIAFLIMGGLNLALAVGMSVGGNVTCSNPNTKCELFGAVVFGTEVGASVVGAILVAIGIPLLVRGNRDLVRANNPELRADEQLWKESDAFRLQTRRLGLRLLGAAGGMLALSIASFGVWAYGYSQHPYDSWPPAMGAVAMAAQITSIILFSVGGVMVYRSRDVPVRLNLQLGSSVGLNGAF